MNPWPLIAHRSFYLAFVCPRSLLSSGRPVEYDPAVLSSARLPPHRPFPTALLRLPARVARPWSFAYTCICILSTQVRISLCICTCIYLTVRCYSTKVFSAKRPGGRRNGTSAAVSPLLDVHLCNIYLPECISQAVSFLYRIFCDTQSIDVAEHYVLSH